VTSSTISSSSIAASRTTTQLKRRSAVGGMRNFSGSDATRLSRSALGKPKPIKVSSDETPA